MRTWLARNYVPAMASHCQCLSAAAAAVAAGSLWSAFGQHAKDMRASRRAKHTPIVLRIDLQMLFTAVQPRLLASFLAMARVADTAAECGSAKHVQTQGQ